MVKERQESAEALSHVQQQFVQRITAIYERLEQSSVPSLATRFTPIEIEDGQTKYIKVEWTHVRSKNIQFQISLYDDISAKEKPRVTTQYILSYVKNPSTARYTVRLEHKTKIHRKHPSSFDPSVIEQFQNDPVLKKILEHLEVTYSVRGNV